MKLEDLQKRLQELKRQKFLSDDEIEEKEQILETIAVMRNERINTKHTKENVEKPQMKQKREHSVIGKMMIKGVKAAIEHFKEKPVTLEELQALKLIAMKERYKADIAKSNKIQRDFRGDIFGSGQSARKSGRKSSKGDSMDDVSRILRGSVGGSNNIKMFSNSSSKDIRKLLR